MLSFILIVISPLVLLFIFTKYNAKKQPKEREFKVRVVPRYSGYEYVYLQYKHSGDFFWKDIYDIERAILDEDNHSLDVYTVRIGSAEHALNKFKTYEVVKKHQEDILNELDRLNSIRKSARRKRESDAINIYNNLNNR